MKDWKIACDGLAGQQHTVPEREHHMNKTNTPGSTAWWKMKDPHCDLVTTRLLERTLVRTKDETRCHDPTLNPTLGVALRCSRGYAQLIWVRRWKNARGMNITALKIFPNEVA
jgi:hypothetical protein